MSRAIVRRVYQFVRLSITGGVTNEPRTNFHRLQFSGRVWLTCSQIFADSSKDIRYVLYTMTRFFNDTRELASNPIAMLALVEGIRS
jgi:hypothetical protein